MSNTVVNVVLYQKKVSACIHIANIYHLANNNIKDIFDDIKVSFKHYKSDNLIEIVKFMKYNQKYIVLLSKYQMIL